MKSPAITTNTTQTNQPGQQPTLGTISSPINQTATPTSNLINTAIAVGAANNGNYDSNNSTREPASAAGDPELVRRSGRTPKAKTVVKYGGVSYG